MDAFFIFLILLVVVGGIIAFVLKVVFVGFLIKKGIDAFQQHQDAFDRALRDQQVLLRNAAPGGRSTTPQLANQFQAAYMRAQSELRHLDDLRRQQSELRLADMTSQAASVGIFIDPSSLR